MDREGEIFPVTKDSDTLTTTTTNDQIVGESDPNNFHLESASSEIDTISATHLKKLTIDEESESTGHRSKSPSNSDCKSLLNVRLDLVKDEHSSCSSPNDKTTESSTCTLESRASTSRPLSMIDSQVRDISEMIETQSKSVFDALSYHANSSSFTSTSPNQSRKCLSNNGKHVNNDGEIDSDTKSIITNANANAENISRKSKQSVKGRSEKLAARLAERCVDDTINSNLDTDQHQHTSPPPPAPALHTNPCYHLTTATSSSSHSSIPSSPSSAFSSFRKQTKSFSPTSQRDHRSNSTTVTVSTCPRCGSETTLHSDRSKQSGSGHDMSKNTFNRKWKGMKSVYRNSISARTSPYHIIYSGKVSRKNRTRVKYHSSEANDKNVHHHHRSHHHSRRSSSSHHHVGHNNNNITSGSKPIIPITKSLDRHSPCCKNSATTRFCSYCIDSKSPTGCPYSLTMPDDHLMSHLCDIETWQRRRKRETLRRKERAIIAILAIFALLIFIAMSYFGTVLFLRITSLPGM